MRIVLVTEGEGQEEALVTAFSKDYYSLTSDEDGGDDEDYGCKLAGSAGAPKKRGRGKAKPLKLDILTGGRRSISTSVPFSRLCLNPQPSSPAAPKVSDGSSSRKTHYLLGKSLHPSTLLGYIKLPKMDRLLQKILGILQEEKVTEITAVRRVSDEMKEVWRHHFGLRVIMGQDFEGQKLEKEKQEERKMIVRDPLIDEIILIVLRKYRRLEYDKRRLHQRSIFEEQERRLMDALSKPVNIFKAGRWQTMKVNKTKERVWRLSGEQVLQYSGILL